MNVFTKFDKKKFPRGVQGNRMDEEFKNIKLPVQHIKHMQSVKTALSLCLIKNECNHHKLTSDLEVSFSKCTYGMTVQVLADFLLESFHLLVFQKT